MFAQFIGIFSLVWIAITFSDIVLAVCTNISIDYGPMPVQTFNKVTLNLFCLQENYFGAYQIYRDFDARSLSKIKRTVTSQDVGGDDLSITDVDPLSLRPMEANVLVNLGSIRAELTQVHYTAFACSHVRLFCSIVPVN